MQKNVFLLLFFITFLISFNIHAAKKKFIQWHSTNIQLLRGYAYELGNKERTIITLEHVNGFKYGDFFIFADNIWPDSGSHSYYIEPTLRFSLSKISGKKLAYGMIKDILLSAQIEKPKGQSARKLGGIAIDLNLQGFKFFKTNFFVRDNPNLSGSTYQTTFVWNYPFQINDTQILIEGFADLAGGEGKTVAHQLIVPRLLIDAGHLLGIKNNKLWLGVEWQYWHNKFGVDGVTESVPQIQIKYIL